MNKQISPKVISLIFAVLVICFAVGFYAFAVWQEPTLPQPGGNVPPPLNVSGNPQTKAGALRLGGLTVDNDTWLAVSAGNVGIGTKSPSQKLDVDGNIVASGTICASGGANCIGGGGGAIYDSGWFPVSANNTYIKNHGLGVIPKSIDVYLSDKKDASRTYYVKSGVPTFNADAYSFGTYVWKVTSTRITIVASQRLTQVTGWVPVTGWARIVAIK